MRNRKKSHAFLVTNSEQIKKSLLQKHKFDTSIDTPKFLYGSFKSVFSEYGLCLCAFKGGIYNPSGTAIMIGPHLAMTALHVVEEFLFQFDRLRFPENNQEKDEQGSFTLVAKNPKTNATWTVHQIHFKAERPDIAILSLIPQDQQANNQRDKFATISINLPKINDNLFAFGFTKTPIGTPVDHLHFGNGEKRALAYAEGVIKEVHEVYRDKGRMNFPCFHTNARFDGGMSGGPIFNTQGEVIGLICSNLPPDSPDEDHASYGTLLWPSMLISIPQQQPEKKFMEKIPLFFLAKNGVIKVKGWEKCHLVQDDSGKYITIQFKVY